MPRRSRNLKQRLIDQVLLSRSRETLEGVKPARQQPRDDRSAAAEDWYREQLISVLTAVETKQELRDPGLTDELIRKIGLGNSVMRAWRFCRPPRSAG